MKEFLSKIDWALVIVGSMLVAVVASCCLTIGTATRVEKAVLDLRQADDGYRDKYFELKGKYEGFTKGLEYPPALQVTK